MIYFKFYYLYNVLYFDVLCVIIQHSDTLHVFVGLGMLQHQGNHFDSRLHLFYLQLALLMRD